MITPRPAFLSSEIDKALLDALSVGVAKGADDDAWRGD